MKYWKFLIIIGLTLIFFSMISIVPAQEAEIQSSDYTSIHPSLIGIVVDVPYILMTLGILFICFGIIWPDRLQEIGKKSYSDY